MDLRVFLSISRELRLRTTQHPFRGTLERSTRRNSWRKGESETRAAGERRETERGKGRREKREKKSVRWCVSRQRACVTVPNECVHRAGRRCVGRVAPRRLRTPRTKWNPLILRCRCKVHPFPEFPFFLPPSCPPWPLFAFPCACLFPFSFPLSVSSLESVSGVRYSLMRMQNQRSFLR